MDTRQTLTKQIATADAQARQALRDGRTDAYRQWMQEALRLQVQLAELCLEIYHLRVQEAQQ